MIVQRLTRPSQVLDLWPFFTEGLQALQETVHLYFNETQAKKMLCALAGDDFGAFIIVAKNEEDVPVAFAIAHEDTLPFSRFRTFCVYAVYYRTGFSAAILTMMADFEAWCKFNGVRRYSVLTRRGTTPAKRCFKHEKYGFRRMCFVFEKDIL